MRQEISWFSLFILMLLCGCDPESQIREYDVTREPGKVMTSDVLRDQFESIPFRWEVPKDWRKAENDRFSLFAWKAGPKGAEAGITISSVLGRSGIEAQFSRWQGQLKISESASAEQLKSVEEVTLGGAKGHWIEIKGKTESILGMVVPYREKLWVIRFRGSNSTAAEQRREFRSFCESLNADDSN